MWRKPQRCCLKKNRLLRRFAPRKRQEMRLKSRNNKMGERLAMASTNLKQYEKIFLWTYTTLTVSFPFVRFVTIC